MVSIRSISWLIPSIAMAMAGCGVASNTSSTSGPGAARSTAASATTAIGTASSPTASVTAVDTKGAFSCSAQSGGNASNSAQLIDVRAAHHDGYDRITFEFGPAAGVTGAVGVPIFTVTPSSSTRFTHDASGAAVTVEGVAGLKFVARGASGVDLLGHQTYTGSLDQHLALPSIREVTELGDEERVLSWGVGLATPACLRVTELAGPTRVVVDVQTPGSAGQP